MVYHVYTDGSCNAETYVSASAYLIITKTAFICSDTEVFRCKTATLVELKAISLALKALKEKVVLTEEDRIVIWTDSMASMYLLKGRDYEKVQLHKENPIVIDALDTYAKTKELCKCELKKIEAHKDNLNPNKTVDRLAKYFRQVTEKKHKRKHNG